LHHHFLDQEYVLFSSFWRSVSWQTTVQRLQRPPRPTKKTARGQGQSVTREQLVELLNEDLAREYQAIIAYTVYSQVIKGAQYMAIAGELEKHAKQELEHALTISKQSRLPRRHADSAAQAGPHVGEG